MNREQSSFDWRHYSAERSLDDGSVKIDFSAAGDPRWAGIHVLAPAEVLVLTGQRNDVFVLEGQILESRKSHQQETFLSRGKCLTLTAGLEGAKVFVYHDVAATSGQETRPMSGLTWSSGGAKGMSVAPLSTHHHLLALVSWLPGTHALSHTHPYGEEILVLRGALHDECGVYPIGSWTRFHPGSGHTPFSLQDTLILLRNGHLRPAVPCASPRAASRRELLPQSPVGNHSL